MSSGKPRSLGTSYALAALGLFLVCGLHRFYLGRPISGVIWLLTGGLCGIGQIIDLILMPAMVAFLPGVKLDWMTASMPLVNVTLALKEIFTGNLDQHWSHVGVIFLSTSVYAGLLLWFAAWWFRREQVLFRS